MRFDREERVREGVETRATTSAPTPPTALVLQLQRSAGNALLARVLDAQQTKDLVDGFKDAIQNSKWEWAALNLDKLDDATAKQCAAALTSQQRLNIAAASRLSIRTGNRERTETLLRVAERAPRGEMFGGVGIDEQPTHKGNGSPYWEYGVRIRFDPDPNIVNCPEIAFIQTMRMVERDSNVNREGDFPMNKRQNQLKQAIDRPKQRAIGYYGYGNDGKPMPLQGTEKAPQFTVKPGSAPHPVKQAWMEDRVTDTLTDITCQFETLVVAKAGPQKGLAYAVIHWGFDVSDSGRIKPHEYRLADRPSGGFGTAVTAWNEQAAGQRPGGPAIHGQQPLPQFR